MAKEDSSRWTVTWLETLGGDEFRKLGAALFGALGYDVSDSDSPVLNYVLAQEGPLAPDVGLRCVSMEEGIEVPALREIDAAVANNAYSFGIVAKNGTFRQEEIMFAQGKRLQLVNSEEFVKKLGQVPKEKQDELARQFNPAPSPAPIAAAAAPGTPNARIVAGDDQDDNGSGTPDFIKKLASVPGFGQKSGGEAEKPAAPAPAPSPAQAPASSSKPGVSLDGGGDPQFSNGLNLIKNVVASEPTPPTAAEPDSKPEASAPKEGNSLPPLSNVLPQIKPIANQTGTPASAPPASGPPASGPPASAPPASGPPASGPPASGPPASGPPASGSFASGSPAPATAPAGGQPGTPPRVTPPPIPTSEAKVQSGAKRNESKTENAAEHFDKLAEQSGLEAQAAAAESIASSASGPPPVPENGVAPESAESPVETVQKKKGSRTLKFAIAAVLILSIVGVALIAKVVAGKLAGNGKPDPVPTAPVSKPPAPPDPKKIAALEKSFDHHLTDLKHVSIQMDARELAIRFASVAADAISAGNIDFVKIGGGTEEGAIAAILKGATIEDPKNPRNGESFGLAELDEEGLAFAANYVEVKEGLLSFVPEGREPSLPQYTEKPAKSGKKMLAELESILNDQHIVASRKNARKIAEIAASAKEGGLDFTGKGRRGIERTIEIIVEGETVQNFMNSGEDVFFGLPNLSKKAQSAAAGYLAIDEDGIHYVEDPDPKPDPAFDLVGKNLIADLERGASIAEKAVAHVGGRIENLKPQMEELEERLETILALTGEPVEIPFADGRLALHLPRDFVYEHEDEQTVIIVPKFTSAEGNAWLRIKLDKALKQSNIYPKEGDKFVQALAMARGRPIENIGGKICYWDRQESFSGEQLYRLTVRYVGFGNSIVSVTDATAVGMEDVADALRLQTILPAIIGSLREIDSHGAALSSATTVPDQGSGLPPGPVSGAGSGSAAKAQFASP